MITINEKEMVAIEGETSHPITIRKKVKGEEIRERYTFRDNAGFTRVIPADTKELKLNQGIKGFSWASNVPDATWEPIYNKLAQLQDKYGTLTNTNLSQEELEKKVAKQQRTLERLLSLLNK